MHTTSCTWSKTIGSNALLYSDSLGPILRFRQSEFRILLVQEQVPLDSRDRHLDPLASNNICKFGSRGTHFCLIAIRERGEQFRLLIRVKVEILDRLISRSSVEMPVQPFDLISVGVIELDKDVEATGSADGFIKSVRAFGGGE